MSQLPRLRLAVLAGLRTAGACVALVQHPESSTAAGFRIVRGCADQ
ncbi:MAG: hypothetical protein U0556_07965 [Dehalococcoidia bacterium]